MSGPESTTDQWLAWIKVQQKVSLAWHKGKRSQGLEALKQFLASSPPVDLLRDALLYRGTLYSLSEEPILAKADLLEALRLSAANNFEQYAIHVSLATLALKSGDREQAEKWYGEALQSAASEPTTVGVDVIRKIRSFRGEEGLSDDEHRLAAQVIQNAWSLMGAAGEPNLLDLEGTIEIILGMQAELGAGVGTET